MRQKGGGLSRSAWLVRVIAQQKVVMNFFNWKNARNISLSPFAEGTRLSQSNAMGIWSRDGINILGMTAKYKNSSGGEPRPNFASSWSSTKWREKRKMPTSNVRWGEGERASCVVLFFAYFSTASWWGDAKISSTFRLPHGSHLEDRKERKEKLFLIVEMSWRGGRENGNLRRFSVSSGCEKFAL